MKTGDEDMSKKKLVFRELIEPEGIEFEYLKFVKELLSQNIHAIDTIFQKCTLDVTSIKKQTIENEKRKAPQVEYEKLYNSTKLLVDKRKNVVIQELSDVTQENIDDKKRSLAEIINAIKKLNDRNKITSYEKAVAKILITKFEYLDGDIAKVLNITTKHVKNNILKQNEKSPHDQDSMLEQLDFLVRCPGCGLGIADHFEQKYRDFIAGKSIEEEDTDFELESFSLPTYAKQVIELKQKIREQKITIQELRTKIKGRSS